MSDYKIRRDVHFVVTIHVMANTEQQFAQTVSDAAPHADGGGCGADGSFRYKTVNIDAMTLAEIPDPAAWVKRAREIEMAAKEALDLIAGNRIGGAISVEIMLRKAFDIPTSTAGGG